MRRRLFLFHIKLQCLTKGSRRMSRMKRGGPAVGSHEGRAYAMRVARDSSRMCPSRMMMVRSAI